MGEFLRRRSSATTGGGRIVDESLRVASPGPRTVAKRARQLTVMEALCNPSFGSAPLPSSPLWSSQPPSAPWPRPPPTRCCPVVNLNPGTEEHFAIILSNTGNTISFLDSWNALPDMHFDPGDAYVIRKVLITLDQPSYIGGTLLNRTAKLWPNQVLSPIYCWANTFGDGHIPNIATDAGTGFYFNVLRGVNILFAVEPGYTPYVYPHPLQNGTDPPPPPPLPATQLAFGQQPTTRFKVE